jgi:Ribbon-helix-helix protein, copG family
VRRPNIRSTTAHRKGSAARAGREFVGRAVRLQVPRRQTRGLPYKTTTRLTYSHTVNMVFHMKTTLNIDDTVMGRLRREAARQGKTMSELVEAALRLLFHSNRQTKKKKLRPLPTFHGGAPLIDISNREELYDLFDRDRNDLYRH